MIPFHHDCGKLYLLLDIGGCIMAGKEKKERDPEVEMVGRRARLARQERHMTLEQVAEAAETSVQFLSQVEKGEQSMTMVKFGKLARALGVSSDYLLFGRDRMENRAALAAEFLGAMNPIERDLLPRTVIGLQGILEELRPENER